MAARPPPLLLLLLLLLLAAPVLAAATADAPAVLAYCDKGPFHKNLTGLQWKKQFNKAVQEEVRLHAQLHCCVNTPGKFKITWYRGLGDPPTRWVKLPNSEHSFQNLQDNDQTLWTKQVQKDDAGLYMCNVTDGERTISETIRFTPLGVTSSGVAPFVLGVKSREEEIIYKNIGENVTITCDALLSSNRTITGGLSWYKIISPEKKTMIRSFSGNSSLSEMIIKQKIIIPSVKKEDFGLYECVVIGQDINDNQRPLSSVRVIELREGNDPDMLINPEFLPKLVALMVFAVLLVVAVAFGTRWHLELRLLCKDRFGKLEDRDDREYDIFVCYDKEDTQFVIETLVRVLEENFGYTCFVWQRDTLAGDWIPEAIVSSVRRSRRFLIVISPALADNPWCAFALYTAIDAMLNLHSRIICVLLKEIDWSYSELPRVCHPNPTLQQVLRIVRKVIWKPGLDKAVNRKHLMCTRNMLCHTHILCATKVPEKEPPAAEDLGKGSARFWRRLRLYLPPRRSLPLLSKPPESPTSTKSLISLHMEAGIS